MAKVKKFEEIQSWKKARSLTKEIYAVTLAGSFAKDFGLRDQIRRAAVSILSNIAEGFELGGDTYGTCLKNSLSCFRKTQPKSAN